MPIATIDDYIAPFRPDVQEILTRLRATIHAAAPEATEAIKYNMPAIRQDGTYLVYFAAWKKHIGLYPVALGSQAFEKEIAPYRAGKDSVQFKYAEPIPYGLVTKIVKARLRTLARRIASAGEEPE